MRKTFLGLFTILLLGWTALSHSEMVVFLKQNTETVSPTSKIIVDVNLTDGKGVAGYGLFLVYDPTILKYIDATRGDYLPTDSNFLRPALGDNDTYELHLSIDQKTTTGESVVFGEGEEVETHSIADFFFKAPDPQHTGFVSASDLTYQGVNIWGGAPIGTDGDGTLASVSFEMLNPDMPMVIHLVEVKLFGMDNTVLPTTPHNNVVTFQKLIALTSDVNRDGVVNILDLTRITAVFGEPVTTANRKADVNADGEINILDLVQVAQDLGQSAVSPMYTTV